MLRYWIIVFGAIPFVRCNPFPQESTSPPQITAAPLPPGVTSTSNGYLYVSNTSIFWPTWTDYLYGPSSGPQASAVTCNAEWIEWNARKTIIWGLGPWWTSVYLSYHSYSRGSCTTTATPESWFDTHTGPIVTVCDDAQRAIGPPGMITKPYPELSGLCTTVTQTFTVTSDSRYMPGLTPPCSLAREQCLEIWQTFSSLQSEYTRGQSKTISPISPEECSTKIVTRPPSTCTHCTIRAEDGATVFYWPDKHSTICPLSASNMTELPQSAKRTVIVGTNTFVSPSVYLSFPAVSAHDLRYQSYVYCDEKYSNQLVALDPKDVSSMRYHLQHPHWLSAGTAYPFNFADLGVHTIGNYAMSVVPLEAYKGGRQCQNREGPLANSSLCSVVRDDYVPWLSLPPVLRSLNKNWSSCQLDLDLPWPTFVPLGVTETPVKPTGSSAPKTVPPSPQSTVFPPTPVPTAKSL